LASSRGLAWQDRGGGPFHDFALPEELCGGGLQALAQDAEGGLWLATRPCGLHRLQDRRFRTFSSEDGLGVDQVRGLVGTQDGAVWASTAGGGLTRWVGAAMSPERIACAGGLPCHDC